MGSSLLARRKEAADLLNRVWQADDAVVVHYSCESFYERPDGKSPRVTSIALRSLHNGQTRSFSIHQVAERGGVGLNPDALREHYDDLERQMLKEFFQAARDRNPRWWVHWNMRDANYGFAALEHRFRVLVEGDAEPFVVQDDRKFDLARCLYSIYGTRYAEHPRFQNIVDHNGISRRDFLTGLEEAEAFEKGEFVKLHQSTLRKVDLIADLAQRIAEGRLRTQATLWDRVGPYPEAAVEAVKSHWAVSLLSLLLVFGGTLTYGWKIAGWFDSSPPPSGAAAQPAAVTTGSK